MGDVLEGVMGKGMGGVGTKCDQDTLCTSMKLSRNK